MKKQFFYAALAIGMMSSCSSNDLPGNQAPEEQLPEEERVAIELGISSPNAKIEASTKGAGPVGSTDEEHNKWNGELLNILMFNSSNELVKDGAAYIFDGLTFKAPTAETNGDIEMYSAYNSPTDYTKEFRYYPQTGKYSFYGYYADNATVDPVFPQANGQFTVTIDGTQDVMTAQTMEVNAANYPSGTNGIADTGEGMTSWTTAAAQSFSAWSARRGIKPNLVFEHKLARFRFFVKAGEEAAATKEWNGSSWIDKTNATVTTTEDTPKGVFITRLVTEELVNSFKVDLIANTVTPEDATGKYILRSVGDDGKPEDAVDATGSNTGDLEFLKTPVAPEQFGTNAEEGKKTTPVGDIMFFPKNDVTEINCELNLKQALQVQEINNGGSITEKWVVKDNNADPIKFKIKASDIKSSGSAISQFEAGKQYDITIIVYGYQKIEITAALSAWVEGGAGEFNPSDDFSE